MMYTKRLVSIYVNNIHDCYEIFDYRLKLFTLVPLL
jgi:hypothetical protein